MPKRCLVVEDEVILALDIADMLSGAHQLEVTVAHRLSEAMRLMGAGAFEFAVLDLNLGLGESSMALGAELSLQGCKVVYTSGYVENEVKGTEGLNLIAKPFVLADLEEALGL